MKHTVSPEHTMNTERSHGRLLARLDEVITVSVLAPKALYVDKIILSVVPIRMRKVCVSPYRSSLFIISVSVRRVGNSSHQRQFFPQHFTWKKNSTQSLCS